MFLLETMKYPRLSYWLSGRFLKINSNDKSSVESWENKFRKYKKLRKTLEDCELHFDYIKRMVWLSFIIILINCLKLSVAL